MTKNQRTKLVSRVGVFIVVFSLCMVFIPYVAVIMAIYCAVQVARQV